MIEITGRRRKRRKKKSIGCWQAIGGGKMPIQRVNSLSMTLPSNRILVYSLLAEYDPFQLAPLDSCFALIPGRRIYLKGGNCLRSLLITRQFPNFLAVNCHWEKTQKPHFHAARSPFIPDLCDGGKTALEFPTRHRADDCRNSSSALSHLGALKPEILDSEGGGNSPGENQAPAPPIGTTLVHLSLCV